MRTHLAASCALLTLLVVGGEACTVPTVETPDFGTDDYEQKSPKKSKYTPAPRADTTDGSAPRPPNNGGGGLDGGTNGTDAGAGSTDGGAGPGPGPNPAACSGEATGQACADCCSAQNPQGLQFLQAQFKTCACANQAGSCAGECAQTFCAGNPNVDAICGQCLDANTGCMQQADNACLGNASCAALFKCDDASQCASKP